jgi:serine/threonine-protein kinase
MGDRPVQFGKWELVERLGAGGVAEVFRARLTDEVISKVVAIKRILPAIARDEQFIRMFIDEARIAARLSHPNIAQVYDLGQQDEYYFIEMEYVPGWTLADIITSYRQRHGEVLPLWVTLHVMRHVADALDYAHAATDPAGRPLHLIHRDVSPANIMLTPEGNVKVIDFGLAKATGRLEETGAGIVKGKIRYLAPEQARGDSIDHRIDVYAAGAVLYELVTGQRLVDGANDFDVVVKVQRGVDARPRAIRPELPERLEHVIRCAVAPDPERRYASAGELHDALEGAAYELGQMALPRHLSNLLQACFPGQAGAPDGRGDRPAPSAPERAASAGSEGSEVLDPDDLGAQLFEQSALHTFEAYTDGEDTHPEGIGTPESSGYGSAEGPGQPPDEDEVTALRSLPEGRKSDDAAARERTDTVPVPPPDFEES